MCHLMSTQGNQVTTLLFTYSATRRIFIHR